MRKHKSQNIKLLLTLTILSILGIGIGYSALTQKLTINSSVAINEMKWDVGFTSAEDNGGTIVSESSISNDRKSLTVLCDFGTSVNKETCTTKAVITNNSTFDVGLTKDPVITYDDTYIHTLTFKWNNHPTYENKTVLKDNFIAKGESEEVILTIKSKFLDLGTSPTEETIVPVTITLDFAEWEQGTLPTKSDLAILKSTTYSDTTAFRNATYKEKIKTITFENKINVPADATETWDIGVNAGKVMAYVVPNETDSTYYDLFIQSNTQLYANSDMVDWFNGLTNVDCINGLKLLDTSDVTNMVSMFWATGYNSSIFELDVSNFDTSKVTDMSYMFNQTGYNSEKFMLDVSNFDTSNVTNTNYMFADTGYSNRNFILDTSDFDTKNTTSMVGMFWNTGYSSEIFTLNVSNFNMKKTLDTSYMFNRTGYNSKSISLDVSNFDTSNVTNMSHMFADTGYSNPNFQLNVSNFDTSNVNNMSHMFWQTGYKSEKLTLNVSNFDTMKVTNMSYMFNGTGYNSKSFRLNLNNFDTSNVTDMSYMFADTGFNNQNFTLDISNFDTSNVINMDYMFYQTGYNSTKLNTVVLIKNKDTTYVNMFNGVATKPGSQITINYTSATSDLVDAMIATKSIDSNVIKGVQVD